MGVALCGRKHGRHSLDASRCGDRRVSRIEEEQPDPERIDGARHRWQPGSYGSVQGFESGLRPVERVSWLEASQFGDKLHEHLGEDGWHAKGTFRLPSEAEWEYAARAGTTSDWYCGDADHKIHQHIWNAGNSGAKTNIVGQKEANPWGLHDICGNVGEWCLDNWHPNHQALPLDGKPRVGGGDAGRRVHKGGSWFTESEATRCGARASALVDKCSDGIGLRVLWQEL